MQAARGHDFLYIHSSVEMTCLGKEDTGEVDGGILTLAGPCAMAKISMEKREYHSLGNEKDVQSIQADDGRDLYEKDKNDGDDVAIIFDTLDDLVEEALLIWVCAHCTLRESWLGHGLALARVEEDKYRRLGVALRSFWGQESARAFSAGFSQKQIRLI